MQNTFFPTRNRSFCTGSAALERHVRCMLTLLQLWLLLIPASVMAQSPFTVTAMPESSGTFPVSTGVGGFVAQSADPVAPVNKRGVHASVAFLGTNKGSKETLNGAGLIYRLRFDFPTTVVVDSITVSGSGYNGPNAMLRLLDSQKKALSTLPTNSGNDYTVYNMNAGGVQGKTFYLDEFDTSTGWRYRDGIVINFHLASAYTFTPTSESSATYPANTQFGGFTSESISPQDIFHAIPVQFKGWNKGGSTETLNGAYLVYRFRITFPQAVQMNSVTVSGAAFNGPKAVLRLLDANRKPIVSTATSSGNGYRAFTLNAAGARGQTFYIDEFDTSSDWRYRDGIVLSYTAAPGFTITIGPTSSRPWPARAGFGFTAQTGDPTAPFNNLSVTYRGWYQAGSTETLNDNYLVCRYRIDFPKSVQLNKITLSGAAFNNNNGTQPVFRLLDSNANVLKVIATSGGNTYQTFILNTGGVNGKTFYLDEFDASTDWRYRDGIFLDYK